METEEYRILSGKIDDIKESIERIAVQSEMISNSNEKISANKKSLDENWNDTRLLERRILKVETRITTVETSNANSIKSWMLLISISVTLIGIACKLIWG